MDTPTRAEALNCEIRTLSNADQKAHFLLETIIIAVVTSANQLLVETRLDEADKILTAERNGTVYHCPTGNFLTVLYDSPYVHS